MTGEAVAGIRVAVVGGGLAGIAAALKLADSGAAVTLYESKPKLGGLTHSFQREGRWVDNGQHVFMRCCTAYQAFLKRLGVQDKVTLQDRLDVPLTDGRREARLRRSNLPAPLHLGSSLAALPWISTVEKARFVGAALALKKVDRADPRADRISFGRWLDVHRQGPRAMELLWDLFSVATLNAPAKNVSLASAAMVFQVGLLTQNSAADIGWANVPLQELHGDASARALTDAGVQIQMKNKVVSLQRVSDGWWVQSSAANSPGRFDGVILAAPPRTTERLAPPGAVRAADGWANRLGASPIVNIHTVFDRKVMDHPFVAGVGSSLQWIFDRTEQGGVNERQSGKRQQYIAVSMSAADQLIDVPAEILRQRYLPEMLKLFPRAVDAQVIDFFVTREREATFDPAPGSGASRPPVKTAAEGLYLAGAWTDTGWPATMEGAVRSGESAAAALLGGSRSSANSTSTYQRSNGGEAA